MCEKRVESREQIRSTRVSARQGFPMCVRREWRNQAKGSVYKAEIGDV